MWLGRGDNTMLLYTKRDYTTKRVGMLFDKPTFQTINEGFGFADYMLGGYFTPLESQIRYMADRYQGTPRRADAPADR